MRWSYKTVHYELKKEGLLGSAFLDAPEIELSLNEYGRAGWELVSTLETMDGIIDVFKQVLTDDSPSFYQINPVEGEHNKKMEEKPVRTSPEKAAPVPLETSTRNGVNAESGEKLSVLDEFEVVETDPGEEEPVEEEPLGPGGDAGTIRIE